MHINRNKYIVGIILIIYFVFNSGIGSMAQKPIHYGDEALSILISADLYLFEDTIGKYNLNDILNNQNITFTKSKEKIPSYSFTKSGIWCKFRLNNTSGKPTYLEISPPILNEICLYKIYRDKAPDSLCLGSFNTNKNNNAFESANYIFKLDDDAGYYLLRIKSKTRLFIKAQVASYSALTHKSRKGMSLQALYAGFLFMIVIYHLFLFVTTHEKIYLFYLFHLINSAIYFLYMSGFGIEYLWNKIPVINSYFIAVISLGFVLSILFVINFLDSRKEAIVVHYLLIVAIAVLVINAIIDFAGFYIISGKVLNYLGLATITFVLMGTISLIRKGFRPAYIFLSAWILYLIGIAIQTLQSLNFILTNEYTSNSIQIGSSLEIILLSIAVGHKLNNYKRDKLSAKQREIKILKEQKSLKDNQKERLEEQFQEQTEHLFMKNRELKYQNQEIRKKLEEISIQNSKILEFHELLETKNQIITKQNTELIRHKENLEQLIEERTWELKEATRQAEEADQLKTAFLKDFSHELRTPMNAIAGFSSLLLDIDVEDKSYDYYAGIIVENTDNLLELVDNIVDLSKLQTGKLYLKKIRFDLSKMFLALKERFNEKLRKEKKSFIELIYSIPTNSANKVLLDYNRFWKIVFQLIDNSIKYTEVGYIKFGYKQIEGTNSIEIFVEDTGVGIKKEKLENAFESFRKVEKSKLKFYPGTGLGLSLVKGLVGLMEGNLFIESVSEDEFPDKKSGTSIKIQIPNVFV